METSGVLWNQEHAHPPEEVLERYVMCRSTEEECEQVEDHILFCKSCQALLDESDHWVALMKAAALPDGLRKPEMVSPYWKRLWQAVSGSLASIPQPALAGAFGALLVVLMITPALISTLARRSTGDGTQAVVRLAAMRGNLLDVYVRAGIPFEIVVEDSDNKGSPASIALVNAAGKQVWNGPLQENHAKLPPLAPGSYWVRLFSTASGEQTKEYGLSVR